MSFSTITSAFRAAENRLILLDYDGTLVGRPAIPTDELLETLSRLLQTSHTKVMIVTGRNQADMDTFLGHLPIDLFAEHGALHRRNGQWLILSEDHGAWKSEMIPHLQKLTSDFEGTFLEIKSYALAWHYKDIAGGYDVTKAFRQQMSTLVEQHQLKWMDGKDLLEVMHHRTGKGNAVENLVNNTPYDFILCIGDDVMDEEMFDILNPHPQSFTIKVGAGNTVARERVPSPSQVISLLQSL